MSESESTSESSARATYVEVLKLKSSEAGTFMTNILRVEALYLAITGALLKFALDANATPPLRSALSWLGLSLAGLLWLAALFAELYRRTLLRDFALIHEKLQLSGIAPDFETGIRLGIVGIAAMNLAIIGGWSYLLLS
jgi:hypothetical protein